MPIDYLNHCKRQRTIPCTVANFSNGRIDDSFEDFYKCFVPSVVGKNKFKARMYAPVHLDSAMCTVSDEACTLLLLENSYDRWTDVHKNKMEGSTILDPALAHADDKRKRKWESNVTPKYTDGGIVYTDNRKRGHKGWKDSGIQRFNELCKFVREDRKSHPAVVPALVQKWKTSRDDSSRPAPPVVVVAGTEAYHELWDDEPAPAPGPPTTPVVMQRTNRSGTPTNNAAV